MKSGQRYGAGGAGPSLYLQDPDGNKLELKGPATDAAPGKRPPVFAIVDVFAPVPLSGNPLAVVDDADALSDDTMRKIAREFNQAETTFLLAPQHGGTRRCAPSPRTARRSPAPVTMRWAPGCGWPKAAGSARSVTAWI